MGKRRNKHPNNPLEQDVAQRGQRSFVTDKTIADRNEKIHKYVLSDDSDDALEYDHSRISKSQMRRGRNIQHELADVIYEDDHVSPKYNVKSDAHGAKWSRPRRDKKESRSVALEKDELKDYVDQSARKIHANKEVAAPKEPVITVKVSDDNKIEQPRKKKKGAEPEHIKKHVPLTKMTPESPFVQPLSKNAKGIDNQARKALQKTMAPVETGYLSSVQAITKEALQHEATLDKHAVRSLEDVIDLARQKVIDNKSAMREFIYQREIKHKQLKDGATLKQNDFLLKRADENRQLRGQLAELESLVTRVKEAKKPLNSEDIQISDSVREVIHHHKETLDEQMLDTPRIGGRARKFSFSTDKNVTESMMEHLFEVKIPKLTKADILRYATHMRLNPNYVDLDPQEVSRVLSQISSGSSILLPRETQRNLKRLLKVEERENRKKVPEKEFHRRVAKKRRAAFESLNTTDQLNILKAKFASGHDLSGLFRTAVSAAEFEGRGFWSNVGYLVSKKRKAAEQEFIGQEAEKFVRASLTNLGSTPTDIRGNLRVFYDKYIATLDINNEERAELLEKVKQARTRNRYKIGTSDEELQLLHRTMRSKLGATISNPEFDELLTHIGAVRELQVKMQSVGHSSASATLGDALDDVIKAKTPEDFYKAKNKLAEIRKSESLRVIPEEVVDKFKKTEQAFSAARSQRNALFRVGSTMGIIGGTMMGVVGLAGWALTGVMNLSTKANNYLSKLQRQDFGTGRALTTQMVSTTNQRAVQQMQQNKFGARRHLGLEARLVGK